MVALFRSLERGDDVTYVLSADLRVIRTNAAWERFARANGGAAFLATWRRGTPLLDVIPAPLQPFYVTSFERAARDVVRWDHDYECSSPTEWRQFRMLAYPFDGAFVVTHSLLVARPHDADGRSVADDYVSDGIISMCSHCRRVRCRGAERRWDWVSQYVAQPPPRVSHGLCPACTRYYYGVDAPSEYGA